MFSSESRSEISNFAPTAKRIFQRARPSATRARTSDKSRPAAGSPSFDKNFSFSLSLSHIWPMCVGHVFSRVLYRRLALPKFSSRSLPLREPRMIYYQPAGEQVLSFVCIHTYTRWFCARRGFWGFSAALAPPRCRCESSLIVARWCVYIGKQRAVVCRFCKRFSIVARLTMLEVSLCCGCGNEELYLFRWIGG